jgi:hypothetical protein
MALFFAFLTGRLQSVPSLALFVPPLAVIRPFMALFGPQVREAAETRPAMAFTRPFSAQTSRVWKISGIAHGCRGCDAVPGLRDAALKVQTNAVHAARTAWKKKRPLTAERPAGVSV